QRAQQLRAVGLGNSFGFADLRDRHQASPRDLHQATDPVFFVRAQFHRSLFTLTVSKPRSNPSSSFAASDIMDRSHGGSNTSSTLASVMPGTSRSLCSTCPGRIPATGQFGAVSVIRT